MREREKRVGPRERERCREIYFVDFRPKNLVLLVLLDFPSPKTLIVCHKT